MCSEFSKGAGNLGRKTTRDWFHFDRLAFTYIQRRLSLIQAFMKSLRECAAINVSLNGSHLYARSTKLFSLKKIKSLDIFKTAANHEFCPWWPALLNKTVSCHVDSILTNPGRLASCSKQVPFLLPSLGDLIRTPLGRRTQC